MKCQYLPSDLKNYQLTLSLWGFLRDLEVIAESGMGSDMRCVNRSDELIKPFELLKSRSKQEMWVDKSTQLNLGTSSTMIMWFSLFYLEKIRSLEEGSTE
jgi:hypothetical protein